MATLEQILDKRSSLPTASAASLTPEELVFCYQDTGDRRITEILVKSSIPLITSIARKFTDNPDLRQDLRQEGAVGMLDAVDKYSPEKGAQFFTYADFFIVGRMKHFLRDNHWSLRPPSYIQELSSYIQRESETVYKQTGERLQSYELAERLGIPEENIIEAMKVQNHRRPEYFSTPKDSEDDGSQTLEDLVGLPDKNLSDVDEYTELHDAIAKLRPKYRDVILMKYYQDLDDSDICHKYGVSDKTVSRWHKNAVKQLSSMLSPAKTAAQESPAIAPVELKPNLMRAAIAIWPYLDNGRVPINTKIAASDANLPYIAMSAFVDYLARGSTGVIKKHSEGIYGKGNPMVLLDSKHPLVYSPALRIEPFSPYDLDTICRPRSH